MKRQLLASAGILALTVAGPARAADMPLLKAPPPAVAAWTWSGFYIGAHGGYGWGHDPFSMPDPFFFGKLPNFSGLSSKGFLGGFQAGANWQSGAWVGGLEIDLSGTDIKGSTSTSSVVPFGATTASQVGTITDKFDWLGSSRARLGYLVWPNVLLYASGGPAWTRFAQSAVGTQTALTLGPPPQSFVISESTSTPSWKFGWVAGVGTEARILDSHWLARLEYLHYDFGDLGTTISNNLVRSSSGHLTADVVRAGLSYKFDPGPFAAAAAGAVSAGMPIYKAPPRPMAAWSWSGFYLGGHVGYGWGHDPFDLPFTDLNLTLSGVSSKGFLGGFQTGANWQAGAWVSGLEIDLSGTDINGSTSGASTVTVGGVTSTTVVSQTDKFDLLGSARARLGYLAAPNVMIYGTGGPAWTRFVETDGQTVFTAPGGGVTVNSTATPNWMFGWVAGLGVEARLWDTNWLGRLEYLHYDFGVSDGSFSEVDTTGGVVTFTSNNTSGRLTTDVVRAALSYKFDWPPAGAGSVARGVMPLKAPARVAAWSWSGFYLGGNVGYGWGRDPFTEDINLDHGGPFVKLFGVDSKSLLGGFQAGANWQYDTAWMGGLEIDLGSGIKGSGTNTASVTTGVGAAATTFTNTVTQTDKFDLLGSGRARVGYLPWPNAMLYGTGGLAWTRLVTTQDTFALSASGGNPANTNTVAISTTNPSWEFGWVAGVGGEARLLDTNWLVRIEYLHYDFGARASNFEVFAIAGAPTQTFGTTTGHLTIDAVRAGFDYKFD